MEITVEALEKKVEDYYSHTAYNVHIDGHRILTVVTDCAGTCSRWLFDALKTRNTRSSGIVVGLSVDREALQYTKRGVADTPYDILQLCIGSHCIIYHLPDPQYAFTTYPFDPTFLQSFFSDSRVSVVGMNLKSVAKKLKKDLGIEMANALDLNELAVKGMKRDDLDLGRYDLDRLAMAVLGRDWDVYRDDHVEWYDRRSRCQWRYEESISSKKVKFATLDPYLCFSIGSKLLEMINDNPPSTSSAPVINHKKKKSKYEKKRINTKIKY